MKSFLLSSVLLVAIIAGVAFGDDNVKGTAVVIDVRTVSEWNGGHLEGAVLIPYDQILQDISKAVGDKKSKILLYCRSGRRSGIALDVLKKAGYEDIVNLGNLENASKVLDRRIVK